MSTISKFLHQFNRLCLDIALCTSVLYLYACHLLNTPYSPAIASLIFIGTLLAYWADHTLDGRPPLPKKALLAISLPLLAYSSYQVYTLSTPYPQATGILLLLGIAYLYLAQKRPTTKPYLCPGLLATIPCIYLPLSLPLLLTWFQMSLLMAFALHSIRKKRSQQALSLRYTIDYILILAVSLYALHSQLRLPGTALLPFIASILSLRVIAYYMPQWELKHVRTLCDQALLIPPLIYVLFT